MSRRFGKLPPLTALEGFEAAARLKSFSLAAEELNITQSAVSHQIRSLEEFFGLSLFNRVGRSVEPTVAGLDFLETSGRLLDMLARGKRRLNYYHRPGSVVFGTTSALASKWLLPRYRALQEWFPEVQLWLYTSNEIYELDLQEVDLAIWYGSGDWSGLESVKLFNDRLTPLYAPQYFQQRPAIHQAADLYGYPLLHDERPDDWFSWFRQLGFNEHDKVEGSVFNDPGLLLESAAAGQGVALGSLVLAANMLAQGQLLQPLNDTLVTHDAYYLSYDSSQPMRPAVEKVKQWLLREAETFSASQGWADTESPAA
ncbi:MAG: LysR substrate-binding domain-containing protein [Pseudomonadota bacterium]